MRRLRIVKIGLLFALLLVLSAKAFAQQAPDPVFLQKAIAVLQQQRNAAMDGLAQAQVQAAMLTDEIEKIKARVSDLEKPTEPGK